MHALRLNVEGAVAFTCPNFPDERGHFVSPFQRSDFEESVEHRLFAVAQVSYSLSRRGVVRGVHYTATPPGVAKYVHCPRGRAVDVVVDLRVGSATFGQWDSVVLGDEACRSVYLPVGVGHLFIAEEDDTLITYLLSGEYTPRHELALSPLDPELGLPTPARSDLLMSKRDQTAPTLAQARSAGLLPDYSECLRIQEQLSAEARP